REPINKIVWQPRIMYWFNGNHVYVPKKKHSYPIHDTTIPDEFFGMDSLEVHEALNASIRYPGETLGIGLIFSSLKKDSKIKKHTSLNKNGETVTVHETPVGKVTQKSKNGYMTEYPVKTPEDLEIIKYIIENNEFTFNSSGFNLAEEILGNLGVAQTYFNRSPLMSCILNYLGFETTVIFLTRHRKIMLDFLQFMGDSDDKLFEILCGSPMQILNFGENLDSNLVSPPFFKKYLIPYYKKRVKQVHDAGKFCHVHMDGSLKDLLPLVKETDFDGVEAATPYPQGDVSLEEIKDGLGDKILLDGIPATLFMPHFPISYLRETVKKTLDLFAPNLILGVSDELPPNAEIIRFHEVSKIVNDYSLNG
ncbi:MAG: uroporphyrinogen decarboxylase family protein, partial [Promethearchaeota archaeon]